MSSLASASADNQLTIKMFGLDDHKDEFRPVIYAARKNSFDAAIFDTAARWGRAARQANEDSVLIADNRIESLDDLSPVGHSDIDTDQGSNAGIKLLTEYCDRENIKVGLKILFTNYPLERNIANFIQRRKRRGDNIIAIYKYDASQVENLASIFSEHYNSRLMVFIKDKFDFVSAAMDEWQLTDSERGAFFGISGASDRMLKAISEGTTSRDVEARCDLVYRLKSNMDLLLGSENLELQARWLRVKLAPLGGKSPIEFLEEGYQYRLAELVYRIEGP